MLTYYNFPIGKVSVVFTVCCYYFFERLFLRLMLFPLSFWSRFPLLLCTSAVTCVYAVRIGVWCYCVLSIQCCFLFVTGCYSTLVLSYCLLRLFLLETFRTARQQSGADKNSSMPLQFTFSSDTNLIVSECLPLG